MECPEIGIPAADRTVKSCSLFTCAPPALHPRHKEGAAYHSSDNANN